MSEPTIADITAERRSLVYWQAQCGVLTSKLHHTEIAARAERRARNIMAALALVGWILALAALGGAV